MHIGIATALLALAAWPEQLMAPMLALSVVVPLAIGLWVFGGRPALSRILLAAWAAAGEVILLFGLLFVARASGVSPAVFVGLVGGPLLALFILGVLRIPAQPRRVRLLAGALWILALAEVGAAIPLSELFGSMQDMQVVAGVVILLLAPAAALGAWGGLALAALIPEPGRLSDADSAVEVPEVPCESDGTESPTGGVL
jgi:hypothetical protein